MLLKKSVEIDDFEARRRRAMPLRSGDRPSTRLKAVIGPFSSCCGLMSDASRA